MGRNIFILPIIFSLLLNSCREKDPIEPKEKEPKLPPITTTGENTFGCKVNGEIWIPGGPYNPIEPKPYKYVDIYEKKFTLSGRLTENKTQKKEYIIIHVWGGVQGRGKYKLLKKIRVNQDMTYPYGRFFTNYSFDYQTDSFNTGLLKVINYDTINRIVSGTFYFTAINEDKTDTIKVADGRFDMKY